MTDTLSLELTTHCQQNCLHCFARTAGMEFRHMPFDQVGNILEEGQSLGFQRLHLTGGEVLLYPSFFAVLEKAEKQGFPSVFINTNGHLLDEEVCGKLSGRTGVELSLSLNGPREYHDAVRGAGAYDLALAGLKKASDFNLPIHIFTMVNQNNLSVLPHFCTDLFEEFPHLEDLSFIQLRSGPEGEQDKLTPEQYIALVRMTAWLGLTGLPMHILENPLSTVAALRMGYSHLPPSLPISRQGKILILAEGRISDNHSSFLDLGRYTKGCLAEVMASEVYRNSWEENRGICGTCEFRRLCRKGGLLQPSSEDHNVLPYDVPFCRKVMGLL